MKPIGVHTLHSGQAIERIRRLRGMTQAELGMALGGITKQAISKIERSDHIGSERLQQIARVLRVPDEGSLMGVKRKVPGNSLPIEKLITFFENILQKDREKIEKLKREL